MAAAENMLVEVATGTETTGEELSDNQTATGNPGFSNPVELHTTVLINEEGLGRSTGGCDGDIQLRFTDSPEGANYDSESSDYIESGSLGPCANNAQRKCHTNRQKHFNLTYDNLASSLQEGLERSGLLLSADSSRGLSSLSLEVMTSGDQLNLLADGLDTSPEESLPNSEENILTKNDEVKKLIESFASAGDASGCVDEAGEYSRCSSSLGCLEPRPSRPTPSDTPTHTPHCNHSSPPSETPIEHLTNVHTLNASTIDHREVTPSECSCDSDHTHSVCGSEDVDSNTVKGDSNSVIKKCRSTQSLNLFSGNSSRRISFGSIFNRKRMADHASQTMLAASSTTGLILQNRPKNVPAKSAAEAKHHQRLYEQMIAAARKRELLKAKEQLQKEEERREKDKIMEGYQKEWTKILPRWETVHNSRKVHDLWWDGLPPGVRGAVWKKAIGNDLNISKELYLINLRRCKERLESVGHRDRSDSSTSQKSVSREQSIEGIHLDVLRTFPTLGFFQEGGPYNCSLHDVLGAYACYRPDIGYVQGMSFLAAVLLLNMEAPDAFITLANLLNRPSYLAFFKVDHLLMKPYFDTFSSLLQSSLPKLSAHLVQLNFSPEFYLIEWIFTIYTRVLPLDVACRVWDLFCRDGDWFLYRTALGILKLYQTQMFELHTIEDLGQFLGKLPHNLNSDLLFGHIESISISSKRFHEILYKKCALSTASDIYTPHR